MVLSLQQALVEYPSTVLWTLLSGSDSLQQPRTCKTRLSSILTRQTLCCKDTLATTRHLNHVSSLCQQKVVWQQYKQCAYLLPFQTPKTRSDHASSPPVQFSTSGAGARSSLSVIVAAVVVVLPALCRLSIDSVSLPTIEVRGLKECPPSSGNFTSVSGSSLGCGKCCSISSTAYFS